MTEETKDPNAGIDVAANVATAKEMVSHAGGIKAAAAWLHAQCPGAFESPDHAAKELT
jgi:hypothetical protein